ncbi:MFS transporter [Helicobacter sp. 11S02596-1]|uniref:MFS transporter n=1 Tax=Helicobacter sp. 11S02596-1 TaxID=1476194 RepID=UPI000BA75DDD|nr:MFS transporter [Helicobacter sp. 11S02596-1]PAF45055.1 hypothetical protein BJI48_00330 [Helicobacter sp. 11S02596-1]
MPLMISIVFSFVIFCIETSAVMVAPMEFDLAHYFGVGISEIGYLVSIFAVSASICGVVFSLVLFKFSKKKVLLWMIFVFLVGNILTGFAQTYAMIAIGRFISGSSFVIIIGFALNIAMGLTSEENHGKIASIILAGFLFAPAFGIPLVSFASHFLEWRYLFHLVSLILVVSFVFVAWKVPATQAIEASFKNEFVSFGRVTLWMGYLTIALLTASVFAAYSYLVPIYENISHIPASYMPILFFLYGVCMVVGNFIVGRLAHQHVISIQVIGFICLACVFVVFALWADSQIFAFVCTMGMGLFGLALNPAMVTRIVRSSNNSAFVNVFMAVVANGGITLGSYLGGLALQKGFSAVSPLQIASFLALMGFLSVLPYLKERF